MIINAPKNPYTPLFSRAAYNMGTRPGTAAEPGTGAITMEKEGQNPMEIDFTAGLPKICVPLTARALPQLAEELSLAAGVPADLYEWRADCFGDSPAEALTLLAGQACRPVLCTLRTRDQGGEADLGPQEYEARVFQLLELGGFQLLDIELSCGEEGVSRLAAAAREKGVKTVISYHDFQQTPPEEDMARILAQMKDRGADLPKLACMPRSPEDVLALMRVTRRFSREHGPVVTMSMGALGRLSRVSGGLTGSCLTFAAGVRPSAPGQLPAQELKEILEILKPEEGGRP